MNLMHATGQSGENWLLCFLSKGFTPKHITRGPWLKEIDVCKGHG